MKNFIFSTLVLLCISVAAFGQIEEKMKKEGVVRGTILKNGGKIEGFIKIEGTVYEMNTKEWFPAPWEFQDGIKFIPTDVFEKNEKIKNKLFDKYEPKDCDGYIYDDMEFESVKYADMSAVGMGMIPKKVFMRKISEDKISLYQFFATPPSVTTGPDGFKPFYEECNIIQWVYKIGEDDKLKLVNNLNIEKELSDCPMVVEKQAKGEYKAVGDEENQSKMNKLINNSVFKEQVRLMAIADYNENCK